jgi:hypothetical protein
MVAGPVRVKDDRTGSGVVDSMSPLDIAVFAGISVISVLTYVSVTVEMTLLTVFVVVTMSVTRDGAGRIPVTVSVYGPW